MTPMTMMMKMNREIELKLLIDKNIYTNLNQSLQNLKTPIHQHNIFFDTHQNSLRNKKWALRLRHEKEKALLTLKGPSTTSHGVHSRIEIEERIDQEKTIELQNGFMKQCLPEQFLIAFDFPTEKLCPFLEFKNHRHFKDFQGFTLELDHSIAYGNELYECEFENTQENLQEVSGLIQSYFEENHWPYQPNSKNKLGWALECKAKILN